MKDEEMANKHAEEYIMREDVITENDRLPFDNGYGFQTVSFEDEVKKGYKDGFLAGLKAGRPQWHKVVDGDLPKGYCLVFYKDTSGENSYSIVHPSWYIAGIKAFFENNPRIIAWCEIPTFDKE